MTPGAAVASILDAVHLRRHTSQIATVADLCRVAEALGVQPSDLLALAEDRSLALLDTPQQLGA